MQPTQCSIDGCDHGGQMRRGMCNAHYKRIRKAGLLKPLPTVVERLAAGLVRQANGCLEWTRYTVKGYGQISVDGGPVLTHRVAWTLAKGPIPDGMKVLHHCDNPPCAQTEPTPGYPEGHLFLGTDADNVADKVAKGRQTTNGNEQKTHCPADHEYTEANTYVSKVGRQCRICRSANQIAWRAHKKAAKTEEAA